MGGCCCAPMHAAMSARRARDRLASRKPRGSASPAPSRDVYHAMTSDRPYRARMSHAEASRELHRCAGRQFDRDVTAALVARLYRERAGRTMLRAV